MSTPPVMNFLGFCLRDTRPPKGWSGPPHVTSVCSVSECVNSAPDGWFQEWRHNEFGFFDTPALALSVAETPGHFQLFSFRVLCIVFSQSGSAPLGPANFPADPCIPGSTVLGFDVVSRSTGDFFECSPLSCNGKACEIPVNEFCLIATLDAAVGIAQRFAAEEPEPGPYLVVEVSSVPFPGA